MTSSQHLASPRSEPPLPLLQLQPLAGPAVGIVRITSDAPCRIGRGTDCEVRLDSPVVSKRHALISRVGSEWVLRDLGSRHGTQVNGLPLTPHEGVPISEGDLVAIKPWVFQVRTRIGQPSYTQTLDDSALAGPAAAGDGLHTSRMEPETREQYAHLINASAAIYGAAGERALVAAVLEHAIAGTGFHRAAVIRQGSREREVEVLASLDAAKGGDDKPFEFSNSLIGAASSGTPALLITPASRLGPDSVLRLRIATAICLPILVDSSVWGYLYLDARRGETPPREDALAFCGAVVEMAGLALAGIKAREIRTRLESLQREIEAAAQVQRLITPPATGLHAGAAYAVRMQPGRLLSGDLFDVVPLERGRVAVVLGDVAGKGVGSAFLMAVVQTLVRTTLTHEDDPAVVVDALNRYLDDLQAGARFVSLWLGIFDAANQTLRAVDAGHGYCVMVPPPIAAREALTGVVSDGMAGVGGGGVGGAHRMECSGGPVVGAVAGAKYTAAEIHWPAGSRVVVFSDGLVEQSSPDGRWFGLPKVLQSLRGGGTPEADVNQLFQQLTDHAGTSIFTDDVTIASIASAL